MAATAGFRSWHALSGRERRTLLIGGAIALLVFFLAVVVPLDRSVARLNHRVARKQADLAWMRSVAPQLSAAGPVPASADEPLIVLVNESARQAGLGGVLSGTAPSGNGGLRVQLRQAPFDALVGWLARLQQRYGVQVQSARIEGTGTTGVVDASFVLGKP